MSALAPGAVVALLGNLLGLAHDHPDAVARFLGEHNLNPQAVAKLQTDLDAVKANNPKQPTPEASKG